MLNNGEFFRKMRLILTAIEDIGLGNQTRLHKAYNNLIQCIEGTGINITYNKETLDVAISDCTNIVNELLEKLEITDDTELLHLLRRRDETIKQTLKIVKKVLVFDITEKIHYLNKINSLIHALIDIKALSEKNVLSTSRDQLNKHITEYITIPSGADKRLGERIMIPSDANRNLIISSIYECDRAIDIINKILNTSDINDLMDFITNTTLSNETISTIMEKTRDYYDYPEIIEESDLSQNNKIILKDIKKLLKVLKKWQLKKGTSLYITYRSFKEEGYSKDLLDRYEYILHELNRITNTTDIHGLIKYLKETVTNRPLDVAFKLRYFLIYNRSMEYITHTSNLKISVEDDLDDYLESAVNSFRIDLKACLEAIKRKQSIKAIEIISTASVKQIS